jgi:hypothetical protein
MHRHLSIIHQGMQNAPECVIRALSFLVFRQEEGSYPQIPYQEYWEKTAPGIPSSAQVKMEPYNPEAKRRMDPEIYRKPPPEKVQKSQPPPRDEEVYKPRSTDTLDGQGFIQDPLKERPLYPLPAQAPKKPPRVSDPYFDHYQQPPRRPEQPLRRSTDAVFSERQMPFDEVPVRMPAARKSEPVKLQDVYRNYDEKVSLLLS